MNFLLLSISIYLLVYLQAIKNINMKNKKNTAHAYFGRPYFFYVFWRENWRIFKQRLLIKLKKKRRMRILSARIFLSLLAGKLEQIERRLPWKQLRQNNLQIVGSINI